MGDRVHMGSGCYTILHIGGLKFFGSGLRGIIYIDDIRLLKCYDH